MPVLDPHSTPDKIAALQQRIGYQFRSPALLIEALTHGSYLQEHTDAGANNQRLEFLGDAVLHFIVTDALYRESTTEREGILTRRRAILSKGAFLTKLALDLGLDACVLLNKSEEDAGGRGRASILEDAFEALIGAIFLDSDLATTSRVVLNWYGPLADRVLPAEQAENPKGRLQELVQPVHGNIALRYEVVATTGPRHAQEYEVAVFVHAQKLGTGRGTSKKTAEEAAARSALAGFSDEELGLTK